jgi:hypothetical protein
LARNWLRLRVRFADELLQCWIERVLEIRPIKPLISVAAANDQVRRLELRNLILNRSQREKAKPRQLARVELLPAISKQQPQHLRAHDRKQSMQQRLFDSASIISNALSSQVADLRPGPLETFSLMWVSKFFNKIYSNALSIRDPGRIPLRG